jgi:sulfide:quinone oxidoreductase
VEHVVILGAGFAGLELATRLSESAADDVRVTLIDRNDSFFFGFSKLDVLFRDTPADAVRIRYADIVKPGVEFRRETITRIDPTTRHVETDGGSHDADVLVIAMGADYDIDATPGFAEDGYEYYSMAGAERLRERLATFDGGDVLVAVLGEPYKCPPAPFEGALLLHELFTKRGIRDAVTVRTMGYMGAPVPIAKEVSDSILGALADRGIEFLPKRTVVKLDTGAKCAVFEDGETLHYDLFIGIPIHRSPLVVRESGLAPNGWVPIDVKNLRTSFNNVYALGDVAMANTAKAGVFAERAAATVADDIVARIRGTAPPPPYDGTGTCYIEFGEGLVAKVVADFLSGPSPKAQLIGPSREIAAEKAAFAEDRRQRWFGG